MATARAKPLSLRAQALAMLARREFSRADLRARLLDALARQAAQAAAKQAASDGRSLPERAPLAPDASQQVDELLDWLAQRQYLSDERFVEARLHSRAPKHGLRRIRQELQQHGVALDEAQALHLRQTEFQRAQQLWRQRFGQVASDPKERAKQARFLAARGFEASVVYRIIGGQELD